MNGYRQLGLRAHDLFSDELSPDVATAVARLPEEAALERIFRCRRAMDLSLKHQILPREEWTSDEEDVPYLATLLSRPRKNAWRGKSSTACLSNITLN